MSNGAISPLVFAGIFTFILPVVLGIINVRGFGFLNTIGIVLIIVGVIHTIYLRK